MKDKIKDALKKFALAVLSAGVALVTTLITECNINSKRVVDVQAVEYVMES